MNASASAQLGPTDVLQHMRVEDALYVLGCLERRVTFYSQQVRALNLIYTLRELNLVSRGGSIIIIGGGVAGLTAAAGAARLGYRAIVLEREHELLPLQRNNRKRWIHPHIYDWPMPDSTQAEAILPILRWKAAPAGDVAKQILNAFAKLPEQDRIEVHLNASVTDLGQGSQRHVFWHAGGNHDARVEAVILAVGFGLEREVAGIDFVSYWQDDSLDQAPVKGRGRFLISGTGDGGLTDVLRARLRDFRHEAIIEDFVSDPALDSVKARLLAIEEEALTAERRKKDGNAHLFEAYKKLSQDQSAALKSVDEKILSHLRDGVEVILNGRERLPFSLSASILNRFLVSRLYFKHGLRYQPGEFSVRGSDSGAYDVSFKVGAPLRFDRIICRHGPAPALQDGFPEVWSSVSPRLRGLAELDQTRRPIYGDAFARVETANSREVDRKVPAIQARPSQILTVAPIQVRPVSAPRLKSRLESLLDFFPVGTAEGERHLLARAYVGSEEFTDVLIPPPSSPRVLVGKKGSGKSAIIQYASNVLGASRIPYLLLRPMHLELMPPAKNNSVGWLTRYAHRAILAAIASELRVQTTGLISREDIERYDEALGEKKKRETDGTAVARLLPRLMHPVVPTDLSKLLPETIDTAHQLQTAILESVGPESGVFYVLFDDTDQVAAPGANDNLNRIWAFLLATRELAQISDGLRIIVTLREEVWRRLIRDRVGQRDQADHFMPLVKELAATRDHIRAIVGRRLLLAAHALGMSNVESPYDPFFEGRSARMPLSDEVRSWEDLIVIRARERPRDAIQMIGALAKRAQNRHCEKICEEDFHAEMPEFSSQRVFLLAQEVETECPQIREVVQSFTRVEFDHGSFKMKAETLRRHLLTVPSMFSTILFGRALTSGNDNDAFDLWRFLFEIGVLNARIADSRQSDGYRHVFPHEDPGVVSKARWNTIQGMVWEVNAAYRDFLIAKQTEEVFRGGLPPLRRPRRKQD